MAGLAALLFLMGIPLKHSTFIFVINVARRQWHMLVWYTQPFDTKQWFFYLLDIRLF